MMSLSIWHGSACWSDSREGRRIAAVAELGGEPGAGARRLRGGVVVVDEVRGGPRPEEEQQQHGKQHGHLDHRLAAPGVAQAHHCCGSSRKRLTVVLLNVVVPISSVYENWMTSFA